MPSRQQLWRKAQDSMSAAAFIEAVAAEFPHGPYLETLAVFADWLEDYGDTEAAAVLRPDGDEGGLSARENFEVRIWYSFNPNDDDDAESYGEQAEVGTYDLETLIDRLYDLGFRGEVEVDFFVTEEKEEHDQGEMIGYSRYEAMIEVNGDYPPAVVDDLIRRLLR